MTANLDAVCVFTRDRLTDKFYSKSKAKVKHFKHKLQIALLNAVPEEMSIILACPVYLIISCRLCLILSAKH